MKQANTSDLITHVEVGAASLPRLMTAKEVAQALRLHPITLRKWRERRVQLPFIRIGRMVRYQATDVKALMEQGKL